MIYLIPIIRIDINVVIIIIIIIIVIISLFKSIAIVNTIMNQIIFESRPVFKLYQAPFTSKALSWNVYPNKRKLSSASSHAFWRRDRCENNPSATSFRYPRTKQEGGVWCLFQSLPFPLTFLFLSPFSLSLSLSWGKSEGLSGSGIIP